jgi:hypothetical protein
MPKKDKNVPTGPTRDPMEVGLARHRPKVEAPPSWKEEYAGLMGVLGLVAVVLGGGWIGSALLPPPAPPPSAQLAVTYGPAKVWSAGSGSQLRSVSIKARNVSGVNAEGVKVFFEVSGRRYPLDGPTAVAPGQESQYAGQINMHVAAEEKGAVGIECGNCVTTPRQ